MVWNSEGSGGILGQSYEINLDQGIVKLSFPFSGSRSTTNNSA